LLEPDAIIGKTYLGEFLPGRAARPENYLIPGEVWPGIRRYLGDLFYLKSVFSPLNSYTMGSTTLKTVQSAVKHWYIPLIFGIVLLLVGIDVLVTPVASYLTLSMIFSICFLASGILQLLFSITNRDRLHSWGWYLAGGILYTLIGILLVSQPQITISTLPFFVGFFVLFQSAGALAWAYDLKHMGVSRWGNVAILGVLGIIFSFILLWNPLFAGLSLVIWTGMAFLFAGIAAIMLSFHLKKL
jgi:uncharacterized membrane protein HdeD (DUF308 family)